jgi:hypothetical protein
MVMPNASQRRDEYQQHDQRHGDQQTPDCRLGTHCLWAAHDSDLII